jgi:hypothetical protein
MMKATMPDTNQPMGMQLNFNLPERKKEGACAPSFSTSAWHSD